MKKIRINELARELEVKPGVILDMLPELGVQEKKTHSSSIDEDVALVVKERLTGSGTPPPASASAAASAPGFNRHRAEQDHHASEPPSAPPAPAPILEARSKRKWTFVGIASYLHCSFPFLKVAFPNR